MQPLFENRHDQNGRTYRRYLTINDMLYRFTLYLHIEVIEIAATEEDSTFFSTIRDYEVSEIRIMTEEYVFQQSLIDEWILYAIAFYKSIPNYELEIGNRGLV